MAHKRMFSRDITESDAFLEMPVSAQALYFHLGMEADDDGFIGNPKKIQRTIGSAEDDLKVLIGKRFVLQYTNGVVVIKHWRINNTIRYDRYKPTMYYETKNPLFIKENGSYTDDATSGKPFGNQMATQYSIEENRREEKRYPAKAGWGQKVDNRESSKVPNAKETQDKLKRLMES